MTSVEHQLGGMPYGGVAGIEKPISRLVMGSVAFEKLLTRSQVLELLDAFGEIGGNAIDTGRHYGDPAEAGIGAWIKRHDNRERVVIVGKGGHPRDGRKRISHRDITDDLDRSLDLLGTDYIDLYFLHRDDVDVPVGEIVEWLNEHRQAGRIHAFGGSNWTIERLEAANSYALARNLTPFAASSPQFSLAVPLSLPFPGCVSAGGDGRGWYDEHRLPLFGWSSGAMGFFSGRFQENDRSDTTMVASWYIADNFERLRRTEELAAARDTTPMAVALAWILHQSFPTFAILGAQTPAELRDSAAAAAVKLTDREIAWLNLESDGRSA